MVELVDVSFVLKRSSRESTRKPRSAIVDELFIQESSLLQPMNDSHFWGVRSCYLFIELIFPGAALRIWILFHAMAMTGGAPMFR
jgi:hypothetical protein